MFIYNNLSHRIRFPYSVFFFVLCVQFFIIDFLCIVCSCPYHSQTGSCQLLVSIRFFLVSSAFNSSIFTITYFDFILIFPAVCSVCVCGCVCVLFFSVFYDYAQAMKDLTFYSRRYSDSMPVLRKSKVCFLCAINFE